MFRHPFLDRDSLGLAGRSRDSRAGHRRGPHRSGPRPGRFRDRPALRPSGILSRGCRGPHLSGRRRSRQAARGTAGQDRLGGQPDRHRDAEAARRAGGDSARSSTAIRIAGAATTRSFSAPPSSGSSAWTANGLRAQERSRRSRQVKWYPAWGEERMSQHDRARGPIGASRASAFGACRSSSFIAKRAANRSPKRAFWSGVVAQFREHTADVWYSTDRRRTDGTGLRVREVRRHGRSAKRPTFSTSGSIRARAIWRC